MHDGHNEQREELLKLVRNGIYKAELHAKKYKKLDMWLLITSIVLSTLATVLAGGTAAAGEPTMQALGGWRVVCSVVAAFTAVGTISGTLHKAFQVTNRLAAAVVCISKLKSLELTITVAGKEPGEITEAYKRILAEHPDFLT